MSGMFGPGTPFNPEPGGLYDAYGRLVPRNVEQYVIAVQIINFGRHEILARNPYYSGPNSDERGYTAGTTTIKYNRQRQSPQYHFTFDTIGQTIYRVIGSVLVPLRLLWVQGVTSAEQTLTEETVTIAGSMGSPIDPLELGRIDGFYLGKNLVYDKDIGMIIPVQMDPVVGSLLTFSITNALIYSGDEFQDPCSLIVEDRGETITNAFRGIRYILLPSYPAMAGFDIGIKWTRTNAISVA